MEKLYFEVTEDVPEIDFNAETGNLLLEARTIPEDTGYFYQPVLNWLNDYKTTITAGKLTVLQVKFEYFNTNIKLFLDILSILETIDNSIVYWCYHEDDEDMLEAGEEFAEKVKIPFTFFKY